MTFRNIYIVDDDELVRISSEAVLKAEGYAIACFPSGEDFLESVGKHELEPGCVLLDVKMADMSGLQVLKALRDRLDQLPVVMMSGHGDISMALEAVQLGALDFIEKPFSFDTILQALDKAYEIHSAQCEYQPESNSNGLANLSDREREVLKLLVQGDQNKTVARKLGISHRTIEVHRARIMQKTGAKNFADLVKIAIKSG